jgi:Fe-S-cluster containining protein
MIATLTRLIVHREISSKQKESRCGCCGDCCRAFGGHLNASRADQERWRSEGREDLLCRVNRLGWIWYDPETGKPEEICPFLVQSDPETAVCGIHETKPAMCRDYPTVAHGRRCLHGVFLKN